MTMLYWDKELQRDMTAADVAIAMTGSPQVTPAVDVAIAEMVIAGTLIPLVEAA